MVTPIGFTYSVMLKPNLEIILSWKIAPCGLCCTEGSWRGGKSRRVAKGIVLLKF